MGTLHHSSIVIIIAEKSRELLCSIYDETYPPVSYRGRINFLGGNREVSDRTPLDTLRREISEELCGEEGFAPQSFLDALRDAILGPAEHALDLEYEIDATPDGPRAMIACEHVFVAVLSQSIFDTVREYLARGIRIVNEGKVIITSIDDVCEGKYLTAYSAGAALHLYTGRDIPIDVRYKKLPLSDDF